MTDTYRIRSDATWAAAREAYLAGETAEQVCHRFDLGLSTFRARSRTEKWRRADQPDPEPEANLPIDDLPALDTAVLMERAWKRLCQAVTLGRPADAARWERLHTLLAARLAEETRVDDLPQRRAEATDVLRTQRQVTFDVRKRENSHNLHDLHPVFSAAPVPAETIQDAPQKASMNRAQRRLAEREARRRPCG